MREFGPQKPMESNFSDEDVKKIVTDGPLPELMDKVEKFVEIDGKNLTSSQLRTLFDTLQNIKPQSDLKTQLTKFSWRFAYMIGKEKNREKKEASKKLYYRIKTGIKMVQQYNKWEYFENLRDLFEAIVAYHRFHTG